MGPAFTWPPFIGGVVLFTAMHWYALRWVDTDFRNAFKLSRGVAAVGLTLIGFAALAGAFEHHRSAFVYRHPHEDWMRVALLWIYGHFVADFLWMALGRYIRAAPVRWDLVIHHLLGIVAFAFALKLQAGYALGLIAMITEVLPISTGLKGLADTLSLPRLARLAERSHVVLLIGIRLPLWTLLLVLSLRVLLTGSAEELKTAFQIVSAGLVVLVTLDIFWVWECVRRRDAV